MDSITRIDRLVADKAAARQELRTLDDELVARAETDGEITADELTRYEALVDLVESARSAVEAERRYERTCLSG